jgi:hypothetical protein
MIDDKKGKEIVGVLFFIRRETVLKEEEAKQTWKAKYDPWFIDEYRKVR